ncbi:MAG: META domain-containing protein [Marinobacter sp.]|nr:META domain-containing protein [Marinobacter sp.]
MTYHCGETPMVVNLANETARVTINGEQWTVPQVPAASGARYEAGTGDTHRLFWSRQSEARVVVGDQLLPVCVLDRPATPAAGSDVLAVGEDWVVEDIDQDGVTDFARLTLRFGPDGRLSGQAGCNHYQTRYTRSGLELTTTAIAATRKACAPALMKQEQHMLTVLGDVETFTVDPTGALILSTGDGRTLTARRSGR